MKFQRLCSRLTGNSSKGDRNYMEDTYIVSYNTEDNNEESDPNLEYLYIGVFDGHGGCEAAKFAKEHLERNITNNRSFWSDREKDVLKAIRDGFLQTHNAMWKAQEHWPRTHAGFHSTSGTTASIAFIKNGKLYIGHVGDSKIVLGEESDHEDYWKATELTVDHKPESPEEKRRITDCGGKVVSKAGVPRVVWNRPKVAQKGRQLRNTKTDEIPFLAIARSLGDLWSYNSSTGQFVVSPEPDIMVYNLDPGKHKCLIFGTDGLWNVVSPTAAVEIVNNVRYPAAKRPYDQFYKSWQNPSKRLVDEAINRWNINEKRADNVSVVTLILHDDEEFDDDMDTDETEDKNPIVQYFEHDTSLYHSSYHEMYTPEYEDISHMSVEDCATLQAVKSNPGTGIFPECVMRQYNTATTFERYDYINS